MILGLRRMVVEGPDFNNFFAYVEVANFEVASDAFTTFKATSFVSCRLLNSYAAVTITSFRIFCN